RRGGDTGLEAAVERAGECARDLHPAVVGLQEEVLELVDERLEVGGAGRAGRLLAVAAAGADEDAGDDTGDNEQQNRGDDPRPAALCRRKGLVGAAGGEPEL